MGTIHAPRDQGMDPNAQLSCNTSRKRRPLDKEVRVKTSQTYAGTVRLSTQAKQPTARSTALTTMLVVSAIKSKSYLRNRSKYQCCCL